jgi:hypothetical protein
MTFMFTFGSKSFLVIFGHLILLLVLTGCTSRPALVDFDKNTNFNQLRSYYIYSTSDDDQIGAERIVDQAQLLFERKGALIADAEFADARVEIEHFIEELENDSRFTIGLGTGSYGRSGSIGVGGSVDLPVSNGLIPFAVVILRVIVKDKVVWKGSQRIEVKKGGPQSIGLAQVEALDDILRKYPLSKK